MTNLVDIIGAPFDQIAFATGDQDTQRRMAASIGGEWVTDVAVAEGAVMGHTGYNTAHLFFSYQLGPCEYELLRYVEGPNWLDATNIVKKGDRWWMPSHMGWHVPDARSLADKLCFAMDWQIVQEVDTISHTNQFLIDRGRRYRYVILGTRAEYGFDTKLIERIE